MTQSEEIEHLVEIVFSCMWLGKKGDAVEHLRKAISSAKEEERKRISELFRVGKIPMRERGLFFSDGRPDNDDQIYISIATIQRLLKPKE